MAEEAPGIKNTKLLVIAVVLGLVVAVLHNLRVRQIQSRYEGDQVELVKVARDLRPGDRIRMQDISVVSMRKNDADALSGVLRRGELAYAQTQPLAQAVAQGKWLQWDAFTHSTESSVSKQIALDKVAVTVAIQSGPPLLTRGDRVNLMGWLNVAAAEGQVSRKLYRLINDVRVVSVGSRAINPDSVTASYGAGSYKTISIELSEEQSFLWNNFVQNVQGDVILEIIHPDAPPRESPGMLNPEVRNLKLVGGAARRDMTSMRQD